MTNHYFLQRSAAALALVVALLCTPAAPVVAQSLLGASPITHLPAPVALDTAGRFNAAVARVGEDVFIAGQPTEQALREMRAAGVTTVVNLRTPPEMQRDVPFDEHAVATALGMTYVYLPVRGTADYPYSPETVQRFADVMRTAKGKVLLHCTVGWRASHLWAAYLIKARGVAGPDALAHARAINLMDSHHMTGSKRQPVEEFLDRDLPGLGRGG
jgi:uncharacterized protein (TIGR01244 family)